MCCQNISFIVIKMFFLYVHLFFSGKQGWSIYFLCLTIKVIMLSVEPPVDNSLVKQDCFSLIRRLSKSITFADSHGCRSMTCFVVVLVAKKQFTRLHKRAHLNLKMMILHSNRRKTLIQMRARQKHAREHSK